MVFRTFSLFVLFPSDRVYSYFSFLFLIFRILLECMIVLVFWGGAFPVALCFLANMSVFTKNAWFSENVRFSYFFHFFYVGFILFSFCFMGVYCVWGAERSWPHSFSSQIWVFSLKTMVFITFSCLVCFFWLVFVLMFLGCFLCFFCFFFNFHWTPDFLKSLILPRNRGPPWTPPWSRGR